ncbi:MAG: hypothetical protein EOO10_12910 [Chitinophagaceae bacterium]|nr:MAG: hypothetical protein EOO10_12910 [Chitinophagaceae bacterium]
MLTVAVKIEGMERRRRSTGLVHAIIGFFLLIKSLDFYRYLGESSITPIALFAAVGTVSLIYGLFRKRLDITAKHNAGIRLLQTIAFLSFGILMYRLGKTLDYASLFIWALLTLVLFFSEKKVFQETLLSFTKEGIIVPGTYKEHLVEWKVLESVTVRHDFITLFHRGKKFLQYQVMQDLSELEVVKMNAYCKENIEATNVDQES